jgi:hypothetical protein
MTDQHPAMGDDDVQGHMYRRTFTAGDETTDDVDGHLLKSARNTGAGRYTDGDQVSEDDVEGHLSGALGEQKRDEGL